MSVSTVTVPEAMQLLSLPRLLGASPDGEEVWACNGRFGPYVKKGTETRNLGAGAEERLFTITLDEALEVLSQPKQFRGRGTPKPPLKELGPDPVSGRPMVVKEGRFGPYVTDGETNASLRRGDSLEELTSERAAELLQDRRESGPAKKPTRKKAAPKQAASPAKKKKAPPKREAS